MDDGHGVKSSDSEPVGCLKGSWPELVGMAAAPAVQQIMKDRPDVAVEVIAPGWNMHPPDPQDNPKRVLVFVNKLGAVETTPYIG